MTKSLLMPGAVLLAVAALLHTGLITPSAALLAFASYGILIAGVLMAWRFHSSRIFLGLVVIFLAERGLSFFSSYSSFSSSASLHGTAGGVASAALAAVGVLLPVNFALLSIRKERGFVFSTLAPAGVVLFVESVIVAVVCRGEPLAAASRAVHHPVLPGPMPFAVQLAFAGAAVVLLIRYLLFHKPVESGFLWALAAAFMALRFGGVGRMPSAYFAAAAFILAGAIVETSYLLAYHDELTTLPSRRAFREALLRLTPPYSIAMVDIDHFKRCNDTYGHDTGDQVLRLVASRLARVPGGGQAYRFGGEEFAILFPGKSTSEVLDHLENLRGAIAASSFRLRGNERRKEERGPDRRNQRTRGRIPTGHAIRRLSRAAEPAERPEEQACEISVTASMGVAGAKREGVAAEEVIEAADEALYRAKAGGRNRIEIANSSRGRARAKAADIA